MTDGPSSRAASGRATLLIALSACGFASIPIFVTFATRSGAPLVEVLVGRYALAAVMLAVLAWSTGTRRLQRDGLRVLVIIGIAQALIAYSSLMALNYIPAGTLSFLFYTYPAWVAIIARLRRLEPLTRTRLIALAMSLFGVIVMVGSPTAAALDPRGVALALSSALMYAIYIPLIGALQRELTPAATAGYMATGATIVFLLAKMMSSGVVFNLNPIAWRSIVGLAVVSTTISFMLFLRGLRTLGPVRTAIISTIEPFFTALLGAWLLGQPLTKDTLLGGVFIAAAVVLLQLKNENQSGRPS
ncbi:MAG TPA: DMT family transporter [Gemmatimonadaceae bacterium]